jgi:ATP-binding cassette, subfamily C, bacterial CydD
MASFEKRIFQGNRAAALFLLAAIFAGTLAAILFIIQAILISEVVDRVFLRDQNLSAVTPILISSLILLLLRSGFIWLQEIWAQRSAGDIKENWRRRMLEHLLHLGPAFTSRESTGELVHTLVEGIESLDEAITRYVPAKALAALIPVLVFLVVLVLDPWTTLVYLIAGPMLLLLLALIGGQTKQIQERRFAELSWMSAFFLDMLQGLPTLKMFGRSQEQVHNIREISRQYGSTTMEVLRTAFQTSLVMEWSATAATALVALEVSLRLMNGLMPFNIALAVLLLTPEFFLPLRQYALTYHAGAQGKAAAARLFAIVDTPIPSPPPFVIPSSSNGKVTAEAAQAFPNEIHFAGVFFSYESGERAALDGFNLTIPNGRSVALVGSTGAGKSTVSRLLLRFIEPDQGSILVGSTPLSQFDPQTWRKMVAWVPQHPHLFYGTIAENIRLAKPEATQEDIIAAAKAAHAHEFIKHLPAGYDTPIGEQGVRLSGGQRQRLAIARAFLKDAPLLILDEATSHLDESSESLIGEAFQRLMHGRTTLLIAHRLSLAKTAQQIAVVEKGQVLQAGTHEELLAGSPHYRRLVQHYQGEET